MFNTKPLVGFMQVATHWEKGGLLRTIPWLPSLFCVFSNQTGSTTCQVHLDASSCPSCILLMALSPINKACSWLLDAACLPGMLFHPTLLYNMHEDFGMPTELLLNE